MLTWEDVVISSLAFDYVENFDKLMKNVYRIMKDDTQFVFSMSHPMATAYDGQYPRYTRSESGERLYANINNYFVFIDLILYFLDAAKQEDNISSTNLN